MALLKKGDIEASLQEEHRMIQTGKLKEENPLDLSETFWRLCEACRRGDLKVCQQMITEGVNINARDRFDYTPLILASLCGNYEVVQLLLDSGALCERDTFQGERCLYNALNDRIRNLLLSYDYSKSTDPLQPFAAHITSLLNRDHPQTSDILVASAEQSFRLHKFVLSARSPYFSKKLAAAPETTSWRLAATVPPQSFDIAIRYLYFGEIPNDVGGGPGTGYTEDEILEGIDKITKQLEIRNLWDDILEAEDRRLARQRRTDEIERGRGQLESWYEENVLKHKFTVDKVKAEDVRWDRRNGIFADVILRADEIDDVEDDGFLERKQEASEILLAPVDRIPIGPCGNVSRSPSRHRKPRRSTLFPAHRAMLLRSEFFSVMFSSGFREAQDTEYLQVIPIDCSPGTLETILTFLYTEKTDIPLEHAIDVVFAADQLLIDKLKMRAAVTISTLGSGSMTSIPARLDPDARQDSTVQDDELINLYDVVRAGWLTHVRRLEEFGARFLAYRLESYIDEEEFADLVRESASRIQNRQATDTIELLDDIRHYLSERFRLRFENVAMEEMDIETIDEGPPVTDLSTQESRMPERANANQAASAPVDSSESNLISPDPEEGQMTIRTLDGELAGDEFEGDAIDYQILLGKIDRLLERLMLDA